MRSFIFSWALGVWRGVNKPLAVLSLIIAVGLHLHVKNENKKSKEQIKKTNVYLEEQGGSHASKEADCHRVESTNNRSTE